MSATLSQLVSLRSQLTEQVEDYCVRLIKELNQIPWLRQSTRTAASATAVPVRIFKESTRPDPPEGGGFREGGPSSPEGGGNDELARREVARHDTDPETARLYEEPGASETRREEVPWLQEQSQVRRAVVLGGPGSGKSFLTQTTAIDLARATLDALQNCRARLDNLELPLHCTLARFAAAGRPDDDAAAALLGLVKNDFSPASCFLAWLKQRLTSRTTWLILDALDEVREGHSDTLIGRLRAIESQCWQSRVLLTCRPANYAREHVPWAELVEYELAPFNPLEIRQFVQRWFGSDKTRSDALVQALDRNYPLAHAARVPLLATFLCLAHEEASVTATTRRVELYGRVVRGLARRAWKEKPLARTDPHVDDMVRFLVGIARPLFQRHPAGNLFTHEEITRELEQCSNLPVPWAALEASRTGQPMQPAASWPTLLRDELLEAGVLVGAGLRNGQETQFSFAHRSLLEYLVARSLNEQAKAKGWSSIAEYVDRMAWLSEWQEVIILLAGELGDPQPMLEMLFNPKPTPTNPHGDDLFRHRLGLAGQCLSELPAAFAAHQSSLPGQITTSIVFCWWEHKLKQSEFTVVHLQRAFPALAQGNARMVEKTLLSWLGDSLPTDYDSLYAVVEAFRHFGSLAARPKILTRLAELLSHPMGSLRAAAADIVGELGSAAATPQILTELSRVLFDENYQARMNAGRAVKRLGRAAAAPVFLGRLIDSLSASDGWVRATAAEAVGRLGSSAATPEILARLADLLSDPDRLAAVRAAAAWAVGKLGVTAATPEILARLVPLLSDPDEHLRTTAKEAVDKLGSAAATPEILAGLAHMRRQIIVPTPEALARLAQLLNENDPHARRQAAEAVAQVGRAAATPQILAGLAQMLSNRDHLLQFAASRALWNLGNAAATPEIVGKLADLLGAPDEATRVTAAEVVGMLGSAAATPEVLARLPSLLSEPNKYVRRAAAGMVWRLGKAAARPEVLERLPRLLADPDRVVQTSVTLIVREFGRATATQELLAHLPKLLDDPNDGVRAAAARTVRDLGKAAATPEILARFPQMLSDSSLHVRSAAAGAVGGLGPMEVTPEILDRLPQLLGKHKGEHQTAIWAMKRLGSAAATPELLSRLADLLCEPPHSRGCIVTDPVHDAVEEVLEHLGQAAATPEFLKQLAQLLNVGDSRGFRAARVVGKFGKVAATPQILASLAQGLNSTEFRSRHSCATALMGIMADGVRIFEGIDGKWEPRTVMVLSV